MTSKTRKTSNYYYDFKSYTLWEIFVVWISPDNKKMESNLVKRYRLRWLSYQGNLNQFARIQDQKTHKIQKREISDVKWMNVLVVHGKVYSQRTCAEADNDVLCSSKSVGLRQVRITFGHAVMNQWQVLLQGLWARTSGWKCVCARIMDTKWRISIN